MGVAVGVAVGMAVLAVVVFSTSLNVVLYSSFHLSLTCIWYTGYDSLAHTPAVPTFTAQPSMVVYCTYRQIAACITSLLQGGPKSEPVFFHSYGVGNNEYATKTAILLIF